MGKKLLLLILATIVIVGSIFVSLSNKQLRSVTEMADQTYGQQARHIANSYAHTMISEMKNFLDNNGGDTSNLSSIFIVNQVNIKKHIHRNSKSSYHRK